MIPRPEYTFCDPSNIVDVKNSIMTWMHGLSELECFYSLKNVLFSVCPGYQGKMYNGYKSNMLVIKSDILVINQI